MIAWLLLPHMRHGVVRVAGAVIHRQALHLERKTTLLMPAVPARGSNGPTKPHHVAQMHMRRCTRPAQIEAPFAASMAAQR